MVLMGAAFYSVVIPGRRAAANPEPIFQRPVFMGSGLSASPSPGMTIK
jgi:hypothetical protein